MRRPVIGITCYTERARFTAWDVPASLLPRSYVDAVTAAGGQPVILPPTGEPAGLIGVLDGLIVAGGGDIDPARYGREPHAATGYVRDFRDAAEFALTGAALAAGLPFLGICRGMQVLNVHLGGTLHQHLPDHLGHTGHAPAPGEYGRLAVDVRPGTLLAAVTGAASFTPAHYHHQAAERLGAGLVAAATAGDGCVEAVELPGGFTLGVQWHPEVGAAMGVDADTGLFAAFVDAARGRIPHLGPIGRVSCAQGARGERHARPRPGRVGRSGRPGRPRPRARASA
ncbi:putative glutamine amidotransferase [Actinorhabdospora filicis]|uniref:Glutamine amidotransferase n=1 Tax=Actinorhabdospora filicis TaxID=1785913 RepID=A0A9W6W1X7_9ACTN|nr:gamma-glutamyl-gamma-aminobutyrate hydrolase family protein [Actinorhabdospora filicis]GLZ76387.1 putative glutamine amidotransferase [Actinorhabdospora filicis]